MIRPGTAARKSSTAGRPSTRFTRYRGVPRKDRGVWTQRLEDRVAARCQRVRAELRDAVVAAPDIDIDEVFTAVYAEMTPGLEAQRQQLRAEILAKET